MFYAFFFLTSLIFLYLPKVTSIVLLRLIVFLVNYSAILGCGLQSLATHFPSQLRSVSMNLTSLFQRKTVIDSIKLLLDEVASL